LSDQSGRKRRSMSPPPTISDLRIVLLGKCLAQTSRVSNSILNRSVFETEDPPDSRELHCESLEGHVGERNITLIITPHLFDTKLSLEDLTQIMKECVPLCKPGPHAFLLVVQYHDFTEEDRNRLKCIINSFSDEAINYSVVISTDIEVYNSANEGQKTAIHNLTKDCHGRHHYFPQLHGRSEDSLSVCLLFEKIDQMVKDNGGGHLVYESFEDAEQSFKTDEKPETIQQARFTDHSADLLQVRQRREKRL
ncbi:GTPase IMAP family member 7-like isoform X1, partial [Clarias magur]